MISVFDAPPAKLQFVDPSQRRQVRRIRPNTDSSSKHKVAFILTSIIFLAPFPAGSNWPAMWMFWSYILGVTASYLLIKNPTAMRRLWTRHYRILGIGVALAAFAFWQAIPGGFFGYGLNYHHVSGDITLPQPSLSGSASLLAAIRIIGMTIFFALCLWVFENPRRADRIARSIFFGITAHAVLGLAIWQAAMAEPARVQHETYQKFATGPFINHNSFATFLGMGLVLGLSLLLNGETSGNKPASKRQKNLHLPLLIGTACIFAALLATQSRMGIAASCLAASLPLICSARRQFSATALTFSVGVILLLALGQGVLERSVLLSSSLATRAELYAQVVDMIKARPLIGFGADTFPWAFQLFHKPPVTAGFVWYSAHSTYLTFWVEYGVIIGSLPLLAGVLIAVKLARKLKPCQEYFACAGLSAITLCAIHSTVDFSLEMQANTFVFLALIALGLAPKRNSHNATLVEKSARSLPDNQLYE